MIILPLHRPLTRTTFPFVTALLVIINAFVFFSLQSGDEDTMPRLQRYYEHNELGRFEVPAYERYLVQTGQADELAEFREVPKVSRAEYVGGHTLSDVAFIKALHEGGLFATPADFEAWKPLRAEYERMQKDVFTLGHVHRFSEVDPWRMFSSAFLHGDLGHLLGNMVFLVALGLLVEGALGPLRFIGVYLLGAMGASAASLWWHWGEAGAGLGASGAIAALMGAFCVIYGRRSVRFFYWIGVFFDYVRAPAIVLLPIWLGWEIFSLWSKPESNVAFDAHAGGMITGALLGSMLVLFKQVRNDFIGDEGPAAAADTRWERAQTHLGKMQLVEAESLLTSLAQEQPQRLDVRVALYRAARMGGKRVLQQQRARELLAIAATDRASMHAQRDALRDLDEAGVPLESELRLALAKRWLTAGALEAAEAVLAGVSPDPASAAAQAQLWLELAVRYGEQRTRLAQLRSLRVVVERYSEQPQASKARFLLENV